VLLTVAANADIYRSTDSQGNTVFSDQKPSIDAKAEPAPAAINAYNPPVLTSKTSEQSPTATAAVKTHKLSNTAARSSAQTSPGKDAQDKKVDANWTEAQCQQHYGYSCERILQWKKYALDACGSDIRCGDEHYLARKYQPVTLQRLQQLARSAAIRNNRRSDEISDFLRRKYTDYCAHQSAMSCNRDSQCQQSVLDACNDPRSLEQLFAHYQGLSPIEKQRIVAQANALNGGSTSNMASYQQRLGELLSLLLQQALLGI